MSLSICIVIPGMPISPDALESTPLGGSESAGLALAKALAKRGHNVMVFGNIPAPSIGADGIAYSMLDAAEVYCRAVAHDVLIVQRAPAFFRMATAARVNLLWMHDLGMGRDTKAIQATAWNIDKVVCVSNWHAKQVEDSIGYLPEQLTAIANAVDPALVANSKVMRLASVEASTDDQDGDDLLVSSPEVAIERDPDLIVFTARPERGLDVLLMHVMPLVWKMRPTAKLAFCTYAGPAQHLVPFYQTCYDMAQRAGDRVIAMGALTKPQLYALMHRASVMAYPTPSPAQPDFAETSCITAMEAMAAGLPFVGTIRGALPETLGPKAGICLAPVPTLADVRNPDHPARVADATDPTTVAAMATFILDILANKDGAYDQLREAGLERAAECTWDKRAEDWETLFEEQALQVNDGDLGRLALHFLKRQDIQAARECVDRAKAATKRKNGRGKDKAGKAAKLTNLWVERADRILTEQYAWTQSPALMAKHYAQVAGPQYAPQYDRMAEEPDRFTKPYVERFRLIINALRSSPAIKDSPLPPRILDYGCAHGEGAQLYARHVPGYVVGYDIDPGAIAAAWKFLDAFGSDQPVAYAQGDLRDVVQNEDPQSFNGLVCGEILEHVIDPVDVMTKLESKVMAGGRIVVTVPYGPWESQSADKPPQHIREFGQDDLREIFGGKPGYYVRAQPQGVCPVTQEPLGYFVVQYDADHKPLGKINWDRKLARQRPRQTISATIIAGGTRVEENLHWCLRALTSVCDEILIGDTGMSDEAKRIAQQYPVTIIPAPDPKVAGFDSARNTVLDKASGDWVLWVDVDEHLSDPGRLQTYCRENVFQAYAMAQRNLTVDAEFKVDTPARLFRRRPYKGKPLRFWGVVHEHPEAGMNNGPGPVLLLGDVFLGHVGYTDEGLRRTKFHRNLPGLLADAEKYPERILQKQLLMRDHVLTARHALETNGNMMTPQIAGLLEKVIVLFKEHYLGKPESISTDVLDWYTTALQLLDRGFDMGIEAVFTRAGVRERVVLPQVRYETVADMVTDITVRLQSAAGTLAKDHF